MSVPTWNSVYVLCRFTFSYPAMNFSFCAVTSVSDMLWCLYTASWDPAPCSFATHHLSHTALSHTIFHKQLSHTRSFTHKFVTYNIFFVAHHLSHTTLSHTTLHIQLVYTCFTSRSSTTSFVFPSSPLPATTFVAHYWKKLTCGVIRSFNFREINYFEWAIFNSYVKLPEGIGFLPSTAGFRKQNHQRRLGQSETNTAIWWEGAPRRWMKKKTYNYSNRCIYIYTHNNIHLTIASGYDSVLQSMIINPLNHYFCGLTPMETPKKTRCRSSVCRPTKTKMEMIKATSG